MLDCDQILFRPIWDILWLLHHLSVRITVLHIKSKMHQHPCQTDLPVLSFYHHSYHIFPLQRPVKPCS